MEEFFPIIAGLPRFVRMAILMGIALLVAAVLVIILYAVLRATARRTDNFTLREIAKRTQSAVYWILASGLTLAFWGSMVPDLVGEEVQDLPRYTWGLQVLVRTFLYVFVAVLLLKFVNIGVDTIRHRYQEDDTTSFRERKILTQLQYIRKIIAIAVFVVFAALVLMQFSQMRALGTTVLASAGVSGIIIGLAAQKSIANLLAGFQIAFTQPIKIDDALIVNGEYGWVEEITLTYVTMRLWDQRRQIVPLQKFIDDTFQNWTRTSTELIGTVMLYVDYTLPVAELRAEVERFLPTQELWDERVGNALVTDNNERTMTVRVLVSAKNAGDTFTLRCATREHLIRWIQENYRECLPQSRVASADALKVEGLPMEAQS